MLGSSNNIIVTSAFPFSFFCCCGFRQRFSAQYCLISITEQWKKVTDKGKTFPALLTDSSKAFDSLLHLLIVAKLNIYGFNVDSSRLIHSNLSNIKLKRQE